MNRRRLLFYLSANIMAASVPAFKDRMFCKCIRQGKRVFCGAVSFIID
ncbi:hypothetical protein SD77_2155 [Bacillus badius]|uniref:Ribose 5-phosphate isomerase B n=1 Tax=Bacillus badius TaxID=1455 RepID=A0ABR5AY85_BACBA|nr:hypothetical protein SD77_2155 [Bacillus badius]